MLDAECCPARPHIPCSPVHISSNTNARRTRLFQFTPEATRDWSVTNNPVQQPAEQYALRMVNIEKHFGLVQALTNINLDVGRNEIVGLIGDNGAGKSTIVKILTGVFPPTSGELYVAGRKI